MGEGRRYAERGSRVLSIQGPPGGRALGVPRRIRDLPGDIICRIAYSGGDRIYDG